MIRVPVWVEAWALGCCLGALAPGQMREVTLVLTSIEPGDKEADAEPTWKADPNGRITFTGRVVRTAAGAGGEVALLDLGGFLAAVEGFEGEGPVSGSAQVWNEPHWQFDDEIGEQATVQGNVVRLRRAPSIYSTKDNIRYVEGYGEPVDIDEIGALHDLDCAYVIDLETVPLT